MAIEDVKFRFGIGEWVVLRQDRSIAAAESFRMAPATRPLLVLGRRITQGDTGVDVEYAVRTYHPDGIGVVQWFMELELAPSLVPSEGA